MLKDLSARKVSFSSVVAIVVAVILGEIIRLRYPGDEAVFLFLFTFGVTTLLLTFFSNHLGTYAQWWKFARRYIPIAAVLMLISGFDDGYHGWMSLGPSGAEGMAIYTTFFYVVISIIIIIRARIKSQAK